MSVFSDDRILEIERLKVFMEDLMDLCDDGVVTIVDASTSYGFCQTRFGIGLMIEIFVHASLRKPAKNRLFASCLRKIQDENPEINLRDAISAELSKHVKEGLHNQTLHFMRLLLEYDLFDETQLWKWIEGPNMHLDLPLLRLLFWFYPELTRTNRKLLSDYLSDLKHLHNRKMIKFMKDGEGCDWSEYIGILNAGMAFDDVEAAIRRDDVDTMAALLKYAPDGVNTLIKGNIFSIYGLPTCSPIQLAAFFGSVSCFEYLMRNNAELTWGAKTKEEVRDDFFTVPSAMRMMKRKRIEPEPEPEPEVVVLRDTSENDEEEEFTNWHEDGRGYWMQDSYDEDDYENLKPDTVWYKMLELRQFAAAGGNTKIIKNLIDLGMDFHDTLEFAIYSGHENFATWLLERQKTVSDDCLIWSIKYHALQVLDMIIQSGKDVHQGIVYGSDEFLLPPYEHAIKMKRICPLLVFLALKDFNINAPAPDSPPLLKLVLECELDDLAMYLVDHHGGELIYSRNLLESMISKSMFDMVKRCMQHPSYVQSVFEHGGHTALAAAVSFSNLEMVEFFLSYPQSMTVVPGAKKEDNPLHLACANGHFEITALLISDLRTNINVLDKDKRSALTYAIIAGNSEIVQLLLSCPGAEALLSVADNDGMISIHHLALSPVSCHVFGALFNLIMSYGIIDVNTPSEAGDTCLHTAIAASSQGVDHILAHPSINVNYQNKEGNTPLHIAMRKKSELYVQMLLANPSLDPNIRNEKNDTPLSQLFPNITEDAEACVLALDKDGRAQMDIVANNNNIVLSCLRSNRNLLSVFSRRFPKLIRGQDADGRLAAHLTAYNFNPKRSEVYMDSYKNRLMLIPPGWTERSKHSSYSPTKWSYKMFIQLVEKRPQDVNVQDKDGNTPLHLVLFQAGLEHEDVVLRFLPHFNVLLANNKKETLLHIAARNGANKLVRALLEKDISLLNLTTIDGVSFAFIMPPFISLLLVDKSPQLSYLRRTKVSCPSR